MGLQYVKTSGKVSVLFSCLSGLSKDKKDQKDKKGQRHFVFRKPSWFTFKDTLPVNIVFLKTYLLFKDMFSFQKTFKDVFSSFQKTCLLFKSISFFFFFQKYVFISKDKITCKSLCVT